MWIILIIKCLQGDKVKEFIMDTYSVRELLKLGDCGQLPTFALDKALIYIKYSINLSSS